MRVDQFARNLEPKEPGFWVAKTSSAVSYPSDGNSECFAVEDTSFWFGHRNEFRDMFWSYPALPAFLVPIILALIGLPLSDRFSRASMVFGILLFLPFMVGSNFVEIRAEMPILLLLLPSALTALLALCEARPDLRADIRSGTLSS